MPKFEVLLRSQTDEQFRTVSLNVADADAARAFCEKQEQTFVEYDVHHDPNAGDAEAVLAGSVLLPSGKVQGGGKRDRARFHMHHQAQPYLVESVTEQRLTDAHVQRLVRELAQLRGQPEEWAAALDQLRAAGLPLNTVTGSLYGLPVKAQYSGASVSDWDTDTIKVALLTAYTPNIDTHQFFSDVSATEITGTGYTAGGATLTSPTLTYDTASDQIRLDAADSTWTSSTLSAQQAVVYKSTGTGSTSQLFGYLDFGGTVSTTAGTFQITWDATGIVIFDVT